MSTKYAGLKVVAVHAHPDDEAIWTGGLLADLARHGAHVTVVTCTLGEQGEVIGDTFAGLDSHHADQLGGFRIGELSASLAALNARGRFLGYAGKYRDSGMAGDPAGEHPRAFIRHREEAEADLAAVMADIDPQLVVTYEADGGYGHPDHKQAHAITAAVIAAENTHTTPRRLVCCVTDHDSLARGLDAITTIPPGWRRAADGELACHHLDRRPAGEVVAVHLDAAARHAKQAAMKAHATQLWIADGSLTPTNPRAACATIGDFSAASGVFALSNLIAQPLLNVEHYSCHPAGLAYPAGATHPADGLVGGLSGKEGQCRG
ncbi:N-acetyl-1-D-myo-inositol-2-amino-2-deoxy-alpha-D-glucopyranoside deacetylase [Corynebacterium mendelii]|uniref:N-acetyl-1-D-myo-inositol-2-amino-2-deoxy-alpha-D-glucopyranoside deacetylase n=1 Tax=Corynebacterium mendelii TaxID=2765362 RepID=A0A939E3N0_9CORY|nr:N-acetyl-1-D-myo-inositol-2-amino-2-deoxy-alpha-D-glucopyranoside deacetylase [Corynebacterium mendelii]